MQSGGLESLFSGKKNISVMLPSNVTTLGHLVTWVKHHLIRERHDMFAIGDALRPGVLVVVNDVDWELHGKTAYQVNPDDHILFISTLHGG